MITFLAFVIILGVIIFVHELGHFLAAKAFGVGVETFAFGFPPKIWSKKVKGTVYKINLIPFGGYVKLLGENEDREEDSSIVEEDNKKEKKSNKQVGKNLYDVGTVEHLVIFSAGAAMNILVAMLGVWLLFVIGFTPIELGPLSQEIYPGIDGLGGIESTLDVKIEDVEKDTPADKEDLRPGDIIRKVDGVTVYFSGEVINIIQGKVDEDGAKVVLSIERNGEILEKELSTYKSKVKDNQGNEQEINRVGIVLDTVGELQAGPLTAVKAAAISMFNIIKFTFIGIWDLFYKIFTSFSLSENIAGPIGVVAGTSYYAQLGIIALLQFAIILSIGVALFNILPIPALDGGYVMFTLIESIIGRKIPMRVKNALTLAGFAALILLIIIVSARDFISFGVTNYLLELIGM